MSAVSMLSKVFGGQYGKLEQMWRQEVVDFLYRNLTCDLIKPALINSNEYSNNDVRALCDFFKTKKVLLAGNEFLPDIWMIFEFHGTQKLDEILERYHLHDWNKFNGPLSFDFINEIRGLYRQNALDFDRHALIPISC